MAVLDLAPFVKKYDAPERQPAPFVPPGGSLREFKEAATEALHAAARRYVPGTAPLYNVYLDRQCGFQGLTAHLGEARAARSKRKRSFTLSEKVWWAITFGRFNKKALAEHRSGYRCHFERQ